MKQTKFKTIFKCYLTVFALFTTFVTNVKAEEIKGIFASDCIDSLLYDYNIYYDANAVTCCGACYIPGTNKIDRSLESVVIPSTVTVRFIIGYDNIADTIIYKDHKLPVKRIADHAFMNYTNLKRVIISGNVIEIGSSAFANCTNLQEVEIPGSVEIIGGSAFYNCTNLKHITNWANPPQSINEFTFENVKRESVKISCTEIAIEEWKKYGWGGFQFIKVDDKYKTDNSNTGFH